MFLSFLVSIPNRRECFLAVCTTTEIIDTKIMAFSDENRPAFKDEKEVLVGHSYLVAPRIWDFNHMGGGHLSTEDDPHAPAIDFFYGILKALDTGDEEAVDDAVETMRAYIEQTLSYYFGGKEDPRIKGSYMDAKEARKLLNDNGPPLQ